MNPTGIQLTLNAYFTSCVRLAKDTVGVLLLKKWRQIEKENVENITDSMLSELLSIQTEGFENDKRNDIRRFSKKLKKTFYIIKNKDEIVGYCIYYIKPDFSSSRFNKKAIIYCLGIDKNSRRKGFAERLLKETIREMKENNIPFIILYVDVNNVPAIRLYEKLGFQILREVKDICGEENCYEMKLKLY